MKQKPETALHHCGHLWMWERRGWFQGQWRVVCKNPFEVLLGKNELVSGQKWTAEETGLELWNSKDGEIASACKDTLRFFTNKPPLPPLTLLASLITSCSYLLVLPYLPLYQASVPMRREGTAHLWGLSQCWGAPGEVGKSFHVTLTLLNREEAVVICS